MTEQSIKNTVNQRINELIKKIDSGNRSAFARRVDLTPGAIADIVGGRLNKPSFDVLQKIAMALPTLNRDWLLLGEGEMLTDNKPLGPPWDSRKKPKQWEGVQDPAPEYQGYLGNYPILTTKENTVVPIIEAYKRRHYAERNDPASSEQAKYREPYESLSLPASLLPPGEHRVFPITDYSMEPTFMLEDYILCSHVDPSEWENISDYTVCAIISTSHALMVKRITVEPEKDSVRCYSDNQSGNARHLPIRLKRPDIQEIWSFTWRLSSFSDNPSTRFDDRARIEALQIEVAYLRLKDEPRMEAVRQHYKGIIDGGGVVVPDSDAKDIALDKDALVLFERIFGKVKDYVIHNAVMELIVIQMIQNRGRNVSIETQ